MIKIVMRPKKAPIVNGEGLYGAEFNSEILMDIRAKTAAHAEDKLMFCFKRELTGKTLSFKLEDFVAADSSTGLNPAEPSNGGDAASNTTSVG